MKMETKVLDEMPNAIDQIFEKFNKRAEALLRKYDRSFADLEEELKLAGQLKVIQKKKEILQNELDEQNGTRKQRSTTKFHDRLPDRKIHESTESFDKMISKNDSNQDDEESKDSVSEKELIQARKTKTEADQKQDEQAKEDLQRKLQLSIQLAARYKGQVIDLESKLDMTARSEHSLRVYLHQTAYKEQEAKKRLELFITGLLDRAEDAERKVKVYRNRLREINNDPSAVRTPESKSRHREVFESDTTTVGNKASTGKRRLYSSSAPTTPLLRPHRFRKLRKNPKSKDHHYVAQFLEPPSSQELPRRWPKNKVKNVDQLPGVDLENIIDTAVVWPFSAGHHDHSKVRSEEDSDVAIKRRIVLFCVFAYLDTDDLLKCALVSREWRDVSKHPKLWTRISFDSKQLSSEFLATVAAWCKETCFISFSNIKGRNKRASETPNEYHERVSGSLEDGLECLLQTCSSNLKVLSIINCDPFLTRRVLWMASCYNRELRSITFRSLDPINAEVTWSLGSGCHKLLSLDIAPLKNSKHPELFNNRVVQMVSWCWPSVRGLSIGGKCIDRKGLVSIAINCRRLQVLELTCMNEITEDLAKELVKKGLRSVKSLILTHTPIRPRALGCLLRLRSEGSLTAARVQLSFADYCPDSDKPVVILDEKHDRSELFNAFNNVMQSLMRMQRKPEYLNLLEIICTA